MDSKLAVLWGCRTHQSYLVKTKSHQWCRNVQSSLWSDVPVTANVESIDKHNSLLPALHIHHHHCQHWLLCCKLLCTNAPNPGQQSASGRRKDTVPWVDFSNWATASSHHPQHQRSNQLNQADVFIVDFRLRYIWKILFSVNLSARRWQTKQQTQTRQQKYNTNLG